MNEEYNECIRFFRKKPDLSAGVALSLVYSNYTGKDGRLKRRCRVDIAPLKPGTESFDWNAESKILINLDINEVGTLLHGLENKKESKFYHQGKNTSSSQNFTELRVVFSNDACFFNMRGIKDKKLAFAANPGEVEVIKAGLKTALHLMINWSNSRK